MAIFARMPGLRKVLPATMRPPRIRVVWANIAERVVGPSKTEWLGWPETKVVMLTVSTEDADLFAALRAGASGYLLKGIDPARLPHALQDVVEGQSAIPRELVGRLIGEFRDRGPRRRTLVGTGETSALTSREWQVLELLRQELSTAEIARRLVLSQATVRSHVAAILHKLDVPDRAAAIRLFDAR